MLLSDDFKVENLGVFRPVPFYLNVIIYMTLPYYMIKEFVKLFFRTIDNTCMFKAGVKTTGNNKKCCKL